MFWKILLIFMVLSSAALAEQIVGYRVDGEVKASYCSFFGFLCGTKKVDAYDLHGGPGPIPSFFERVSSSKVGSDGQRLCWINGTTGPAQWGWFAPLLNQRRQVPNFFAIRSDGTLKNLGKPEYIVFKCTEVCVEVVNASDVQEVECTK